MSVRVLVVEDEAIAAEAHSAYVGRIDGFEVAGVARSAGDAMRQLTADPTIDLVLLDMHLPDGHGLGLLQRMRAAGHLCDVIAVTSARDADVVRHAVARGRRALPAEAVLVRDVPRQARAVRRLPHRPRRGRRRRGAGRGGPAPRRPAPVRRDRAAAEGHERRVAAPSH
ncbi:response regulator [Nocardioides sp. B-3]|uniref:response regulator n=1 Tax=Nocardioides sp. B-3 TaxID=2895565 RepID=UPI0021522570|nr:response regulator [Nocardioides sp. B-3]UUZ58799.1 response regulator [Nocardioides sp. B-3]